MHASDFRLFSDIYVSQCSAATRFKCDRIFNKLLYCKFTNESVSEKNCENQSKFDEVMGNSRVACFFFDSQCIYENAKMINTREINVM